MKCRFECPIDFIDMDHILKKYNLFSVNIDKYKIEDNMIKNV